MNKNIFFEAALTKAMGLLGKRGRIFILLGRLVQKLPQLNLKDGNINEVKARFFTLGRLLKAYTTGKYKDVSWKSIALVTAAIVYFVNPIDLIPDLIPALGFTDDVGILMSVYASISFEIDKFLTWEKSQVFEI